MELSALDWSAAGMRIQRVRMDRIAAKLATVNATGPAPDGDPLVDMADLIAASRAYEANLSAAEVAKSMHQGALRILG